MLRVLRGRLATAVAEFGVGGGVGVGRGDGNGYGDGYGYGDGDGHGDGDGGLEVADE